VDPPTPPPKLRGAAERVDAGTTIASKEDESEDDETEEGVPGKEESGEDEARVETSRLPIEHDEDGRDVVAEQEATGEDGRFDEVAL